MIFQLTFGQTSGEKIPKTPFCLLKDEKGRNCQRSRLRGVSCNDPNSRRKMILSCDSICIFWNVSKSKNIILGFFSVLKLATCQFFWNPHFPSWFWKWGISKNSANAITLQNYLSHAFRGISWNLPSEFKIMKS